ncbi:MAG TPA: MFS transporter [Novosphingobium sp.]|nr:MFS transporter [Novosphingobium sp.]
MLDLGQDVAAGGPRLTARQEWARGWPAMVAALSGLLMTGITTFYVGMFMEPLQREFGWSRAEVSSSLAVLSVTCFFAFPIAGRAIDKYGARAVALPGTLLTGLLLGMIGLVNNGSIIVWWVSWAVFTIGWAMVNPSVWTRAVSAWFKTGRGMAIGVLMSGSVISAMVIPSLSRWAIDQFGWRVAFAVIGLGPGLVAFVLNFIATRDPPALESQRGHAAATPEHEGAGFTFPEALRQPAVIKLLASSLLAMLITIAILVHSVPLLVEHGFTKGEAAGILSTYAIADLVTKLAGGWLSDRGYGRVFAPIGYAATGAGCVVLLFLPDRNFGLAVLAMSLVGVTTGAVLQMSADLMIRYAGLRAFGQLYGLCMGLLSVAGGVGPLIGGWIYDQTGSYSGLFMTGVPFGLVAFMLMAALGDYPQLPSEEPASSSS